MRSLPNISIVVPSFNQAQYLAETLQSIVDQEYPHLEVIIQDGGSNDGSVAIADEFVRRYPSIFRLFVENDNGQADALNRGFARVTGEILAFLNSDDTYFPRILHRVAAEIDAARGRHVIVGRCLFTGEGSRYVGIEHPSEYVNHYNLLAIWKRGFNTIPQPSVFWHRSVWEKCGGLDINEQHALDYDLFCRFSRHYPFHRIDELFSTYRMHDSSKSSQRTEAEVLDLSIKVSRKHWGTWLLPLRWRCEVSCWSYNLQRHERARHHARRAEEAFVNRQYGAAVIGLLATLIASPRMARDRLLYGWLSAKAARFVKKMTVVNDGFTGRYEDGWIGPIYREQLRVVEGEEKIVVTASHSPQPKHRKLKVQLFINGTLVDTKKVKDNTCISLSAQVSPHMGEMISLEIRTSSSFVPCQMSGGTDKRKLSLRLDSVSIS